MRLSLASATATVSGDPDQLLCWLWGRVGDDAVSTSGDRAAVEQFRRMLVVATR